MFNIFFQRGPMGRSSDYKFLMPLFLTHNIFRELRDIHKGLGVILINTLVEVGRRFLVIQL